ncbi:solute carrier family 13 (sodium-dependent dicarboxylate transporter), member 2/3/5 [Maridesulfovibrio ferrireducens]|uniref:Solute carrier family 13 (Sodium-dependent dicarboxylate transporter), member 2/3/5 n=1 Tax=Maridesulfovibrio ferrireducens TaxID=246191 RepID=A0A1G9LRH4_9BACT|nr:DASS family sodium-coupled anion symporter [Maridesulfovibrio ferrireducens]SDL64560.1 solute carrier family 13 (sodium-dependent dicarboxylate transporter), member 2/3/5 [Maridesulfovibrio ferrireducens]
MAQEMNKSRIIGYFVGPAIFFIMLFMSPPEGMTPSAWKVAAITILMAIWWITEALPIPATSLLPIILFPLLGIMPSSAATLPYANHLIYLFMAGFFLAVTMEKWNLHRRVAIYTIRLVGLSPGRMVLGFMLATAFLSMWVSNTATTMMMVPIGLAVIKQSLGFDSADLKACPSTGPEYNFGKCLMLGIAYSASIGGVGTIIGSPPNTVMVGMVEKMFGVQIGFGQWMLFGVPFASIMLFITWVLLVWVIFPVKGLQLGGGSNLLDEEIEKLGPMKREEKYIVAVGLTMAIFWMSRGFLKRADFMTELWPNFSYVHDATIGILGSLLLFLIPTNLKKGEFLLDWKTAVKIPWDVIILFGGGLAIANGFAKTGLAAHIAGQLVLLEGVNIVVFVAAVVGLTILLTETTSNTATATLLIPIMASAAIAMGVHPFATIVSACVAASCAFILPVATPPNAVVYSSGCISLGQMARAGLLLDLTGAVLITVLVVYLLPVLWGIDIMSLPAWAVVPK